MAQRQEELWLSEEAYFAVEEASPDIKYEYSDGRIRMLAGQTGNHSKLNDNLTVALRSRLPPGCVQYGEMRFAPQARRKKKYYYPDRVVCCDPRDDEPTISLIHFPCIVFEILSESTELVDRTEKLDVYQTHSTIQEIVYINPYCLHVEVYRNEGLRQWKMSMCQQGDVIGLRSIGASIPIEEIYEGIKILAENDDDEE